MSVKQLPSGEWFYRFNLKNQTFRKQGFRTYKEADAAESIKKSEVHRRPTMSQGYNDNLKLCEAADLFFEEYAQPFKRTWKCDRSRIQIIKEFFGRRHIKDLSPRDVDAFRAYVAKNVDGMKGKVTLHTVNHYHALLKAIINWAKKKRLYFGDNPAWGVAMAKVERAKVRFLTPDEEKRLTPIVARDARLWPYYVLAVNTGLRIGEIVRIRVCDVIRHPEPMIFIPHSKSNRSRYVPLSDSAQEVVATRIQGKGPETLILDSVTKITVSEWFNECCKQAQVMDFTFHCLRHTFTAHMLGRGVPIYKVSKILGHSSVVVTEQHYGHLDRSVLTEEIRHIDGVITLPKVPTLQHSRGQVVNEVVKVVNGDGLAPLKSVNSQTVKALWRGTQVA